MSKKKFVPTNRNAKIQSRIDRNGNFRTETSRRDEGAFNAAVSTVDEGGTVVYLDMNEGTIRLNGREARTMYRLLQRHYQFVDRTW